jgi:hypothetical protein
VHLEASADAVSDIEAQVLPGGFGEPTKSALRAPARAVQRKPLTECLWDVYSQLLKAPEQVEQVTIISVVTTNGSSASSFKEPTLHPHPTLSYYRPDLLLHRCRVRIDHHWNELLSALLSRHLSLSLTLSLSLSLFSLSMRKENHNQSTVKKHVIKSLEKKPRVFFASFFFKIKKK